MTCIFRNNSDARQLSMEAAALFNPSLPISI